MDASKVRIVTVVGSVRPGNFTTKALALLEDQLGREGVGYTRVDPATLALPLPGLGGETEALRRAREAVVAATGIVIATPEYHGSYSSVVKLFIENLGFPSPLATKPVGLLGVAAGRIGAIKALEHLRSVISHVGAIVLPGPVSVANVQSVFAEDGTCLDPAVERAVRDTGSRLLEYIGNNVCPRAALEAMVREAAA